MNYTDTVTGEISYRRDVEACLYGNQWGPICADAGWGLEEASVVCRQLGYIDTTGYNVSQNKLQVESHYFLILNCEGHENDITVCAQSKPQHLSTCWPAIAYCNTGIYNSSKSVQ